MLSSLIMKQLQESKQVHSTPRALESMGCWSRFVKAHKHWLNFFPLNFASQLRANWTISAGVPITCSAASGMIPWQQLRHWMLLFFWTASCKTFTITQNCLKPIVPCNLSYLISKISYFLFLLYLRTDSYMLIYDICHCNL